MSTKSRGLSLAGRTFGSVFRADGRTSRGQVRYRIARSGSMTWGTHAPTTAAVVDAITEAGVAVRNVSMGSPGNCDSYHLDADFRDGGLRGETGNYWGHEKGAWIHGDDAVVWVARLLKLRPPGALRHRVPPRMTDRLLDAFSGTDFIINVSPEVRVRVGDRSTDLARLLHRHGAQSAIVVTAFNPFSAELSIDINRLRQLHLHQGLEQRGLRSLDAEGRDPSGQWAPEPSLLVLDASSEQAEQMMVSYQQHAIVGMTAEGDVTLRFNPGHRSRRRPRATTG